MELRCRSSSINCLLSPASSGASSVVAYRNSMPGSRGQQSFALLRLAKNKPVAVLASRVMRSLPTWVLYRTLADLDDAIASGESDRSRCLNELHVRPLESVSV